jgi:hypothetical protein
MKIKDLRAQCHAVNYFTFRACLLFMSLLAALATGTAESKRAAMPADEKTSNLVLNVRDYHAVGDGKTDDTSAFAGALVKLAENGGGTLLIPPGTYIVGDLSVGSGSFINGTGSPLPVLVKKPDAKSIIEISSARYAASDGSLHDIKIENVILHGRSIEDRFKEHVHNINALGVMRLSVQNVRFEAFQGDGIYIGRRQKANGEIVHNSDVIISHNAFDGANNENRNGISLIDCSHCTLEHNIFTRVARPEMPGAIDIEPNQRDETIRDIIIADNTIEEGNSGLGAISIVLNYKDFVTSPGQIRIENNRIQHAKTGIRVSWGGGPATSLTHPLDIYVQHNVVADVERPMTLEGVAGVTVNDNQFSDSKYEFQLGTALGVHGVHFTNNRFEHLGRTQPFGFTVYGQIEDLLFEKNLFIDIGSGQKGGSAIIFVRGAITNVRFTDNIFSSPASVTRAAIRIERAVSSKTETNTWTGNVLQDGIERGAFPHRPE